MRKLGTSFYCSAYGKAGQPINGRPVFDPAKMVRAATARRQHPCSASRRDTGGSRHEQGVIDRLLCCLRGRLEERRDVVVGDLRVLRGFGPLLRGANSARRGRKGDEVVPRTVEKAGTGAGNSGRRAVCKARQVVEPSGEKIFDALVTSFRPMTSHICGADIRRTEPPLRVGHQRLAREDSKGLSFAGRATSGVKMDKCRQFGASNVAPPR
jgi:hypothetical protein